MRRTRTLWVLIAIGLVAIVLGLVLATQPDREDPATEVPELGEVLDPEARLPWLSTQGNRIVTEEHGKPVLLRGANVLRSEWDGSMLAEARAVPALAEDWGGNVIVRGFASDPVIAHDTSYLELLDGHVALAIQHEMYVVFAWRSKTVNGPQPPRPDAEAQEALVRLAKRYHGRPNVIYALQVEPYDTGWSELHPVFTQMVQDIHQAAAPHVPIVMVPGVKYGRDVSGALTAPIQMPNVVYKSHPYGPASDFDRHFLQVHDGGLPVFVGEFGLLPEAGMDLPDVEALLRVTRERGIGWAAWAMDFQGGPALVSDNRSFKPGGAYGTIVREEMLKTPPLPDF